MKLAWSNLAREELRALRRLYESPFTNIHAGGPEAVFGETDTDTLVEILHEIRHRAVA